MRGEATGPEKQTAKVVVSGLSISVHGTERLRLLTFPVDLAGGIRVASAPEETLAMQARCPDGRRDPKGDHE
jgi:hypothetical protein